MQNTHIEIYRHAESTANVGLPCDRPDNIPLTDNGRAQALALSRTFNLNAPPDLIITSPYSRTGDTAAPTRALFPHVPHEVWPVQEFTQLDIVRNAGTTQEQRSAAVHSFWNRNDPDYVDGAGAESFNQMMGRVDVMFARLQKLPHRRVVMFSHGLYMQAAFLRLTRPELEPRELMRELVTFRSEDANHVPNTGRLTLSGHPGPVQLVSRWHSAPKPKKITCAMDTAA